METEEPFSRANDEIERTGPSGPVMAALLVGSALVVIAAQTILTIPPDEYEQPLWIMLAFGLIGAVLAARSLTQRVPLPAVLERSLGRASEFVGVSPSQFVLLLYAPVLSAAAYLAAGDSSLMHIPWLAVGLWLMAAAFVLAGTWGMDLKISLPNLPRWEILVLLGIVGLAIALRVFDLGSIPWVLSGDEGAAGLSAAEFVDGRRNNLFNTAWYSWPSFYFLLPAASIGVLGNSVFALRLPSALAGALTLLAIYPFARAAFGRKVGLASIAYLAAFHFHIHFSRLGLNNIWDPFFFALFTALLWKGWTSGRRTLFTLAGLVLGLSMFFYASARVLIGLLPVWLFVAWLRDRETFRQRRGGVFLLGMAALVVILPLAIYYGRNPDIFMAPYRRFSILGGWLESEVARTGLPTWRILLQQVRDASLAFTGLDLRSWYLIGFPMLLPLPAALFLLGLMFVVLRPTRLPNLWVLMWLAAGIAAGALTQSTPAAQRYVFTAPVVALVAGLGLVRIWEAVSDLWPRGRIWVGAVALALLAVAAVMDLRFYFFDYSQNRRFADNNTLVAHRMGNFLQEQPDVIPVYFLGPPRMGFRSHGSLPFLAPAYEGFDVPQPANAASDIEWQVPAIFVVLPERSDELEWIRGNFPGGRIYTERDPEDNVLFIAYIVDGQPDARLPHSEISGGRLISPSHTRP